MSNETLFYICGIAVAVSAVLVSFSGLKLRGFPGRALPVVVLWFAILIGGATTFAVLHAQDEEKVKEAEFQKAGEEVEENESGLPVEVESPAGEGPEADGEETGGESESGGESEGEAEPGGESGEGPEATGSAGSTLKLAADPTALAFDKKSLSAKAGNVTIDFENPSAIEHDVAIEKGGQEVAASELITEGKTSVSAELEPGSYTFLCTVPGHAEAGMEGTLTVK
jgi:plastocyanin